MRPFFRAFAADSCSKSPQHRTYWMLLASFAFGVGLYVPEAGAQDQDEPTVIATARELAVSGVKLAQDEHCAEAVPKLERAEKLHHSQIVLTRLGACYIELGQLNAGMESLRAVLREPLPPNPSEALQQAYGEAGQLIESTKPKLAKLTINVTGVDASTSVDLTIDDKPMPSALLGAAHLSDPGEHVVGISAPGYRPSQRRISLSPGSEESLVIALTPDPQAQTSKDSEQAASERPTSALAAPQMALTTTTQDTGSRPSRLPAYLTWGASAAVLGAGIGFGLAALENKRTLDDRCPNKVCPPELEDLLSTSRTNATISTIAYGVGLSGIAIGAFLFWLENRDASNSDKRQQSSRRIRISTRGFDVRF